MITQFSDISITFIYIYRYILPSYISLGDEYLVAVEKSMEAGASRMIRSRARRRRATITTTRVASVGVNISNGVAVS